MTDQRDTVTTTVINDNELLLETPVILVIFSLGLFRVDNVPVP